MKYQLKRRERFALENYKHFCYFLLPFVKSEKGVASEAKLHVRRNGQLQGSTMTDGATIFKEARRESLNVMKIYENKRVL